MSNLRKLRNEKGLTVRALGSIVGVVGAQIGHYETGHSALSAEMAIKLADYFGVSTDYLLGVTEIREKPDDIVKKYEQLLKEQNDQKDKIIKEQTIKYRDVSEMSTEKVRKEVYGIIKDMLTYIRDAEEKDNG